MHKDIEKILVSEKQIENIVNSLAKKIEKDYNDKEFIMIGLLKGSISFMVDLMKKIDLDFSIDFMVASSYGSGTESSGKVKLEHEGVIPVEGKHILIVEDVIDSGNTLNFISNYLITKGAKSVRVAALLDKPARRKIPFTPDYIGTEIPDVFVVGYGLDYNEKYRNLPYIGVLMPSVYE